MKHFRCLAMLLVAATLAITACNLDGGGWTTPVTGDTVSVTAGDVGFDMIYANNQASITIPTGTSDNGTAEITTKFFMSETQVTYELWKEVYDWAVHADRGANVYEFQNPGRMGSVDGGAGMTDQHPVTMVSWRDAVIWCNALSEMTGVEVVYVADGSGSTTDGDVLRSSVTDAYGSGIDVEDVVKSEADNLTRKGYRLPTSMEWEMAARYRGTDETNVVTGVVDGVDFDAMTTKWTKGNSASGDTQAYDAASPTVGDYAWYEGNTSTTKPVSGKTANELGLYDMSGNVDEWCFTASGSARVGRGGKWLSNAGYLRVGVEISITPDDQRYYVGYRFARTQ